MCSHINSQILSTTVLGETPIKSPTMTQPSKFHTGRHYYSLRETDTPDDAGNETGQMSKHKTIINTSMNENGSEGVGKEALGGNSMKQTTINKQSIVNSNRHGRSLSQTTTTDDAGDETEQTRKNRSSIDAVMGENGIEEECNDPPAKHTD
jgi:hypothetical protein